MTTRIFFHMTGQNSWLVYLSWRLFRLYDPASHHLQINFIEVLTSTLSLLSVHYFINYGPKTQLPHRKLFIMISLLFLNSFPWKSTSLNWKWLIITSWLLKLIGFVRDLNIDTWWIGNRISSCGIPQRSALWSSNTKN